MIDLGQIVIPPEWGIDKGTITPVADCSLGDDGTIAIESRCPKDFKYWLHSNFSPDDIAIFNSYTNETEKLFSIAAENEDVVIENLGPGHRKVTWISFSKQMEYLATIDPQWQLITDKIWFLWHTNQSG
jgi:hypothetical protein